MKQPVWNVYYCRQPQDEIFVYNVLSHGGVIKDIVKATNSSKTKEEFEEAIRYSLMRYFWSKCEYEILIRPMFSTNKELKIDIYDQIKCNWDVFLDYVWNEKHNFNCEQK